MFRSRMVLMTVTVGFLAVPVTLLRAEETGELAKALNDTKVTLQGGLKASEPQGTPISAKF